KTVFDACTGKCIRYKSGFPYHVAYRVRIRIHGRVAEIAAVFLEHEVRAIFDTNGVWTNTDAQAALAKDRRHPILRRPNVEMSGYTRAHDSSLAQESLALDDLVYERSEAVILGANSSDHRVDLRLVG